MSRSDTQKKASTLILIAHGSKDPRWRAPFEKLEKALKLDLGENGVYLSYLDFAEPTLMDAARKAVKGDARKIRVLPLFMAGGAHVDQDIPPMVSKVKSEFPHVHVELLEPIGEHPQFAKLIYQLATDYA